VKRHRALEPFSDDHHHELVQASRLLRAAEGDPAERVDAASAYVELFFADTVEHFRREEEELFPVYARHPGADLPLVERILREHMELQGLARALRTEVAAEEVSADRLRELGTLLREHVRLEERELFEAIQRAVPAAELDGLTGEGTGGSQTRR
jgi:hemerythrin-like domain-containing protein